MSEKLENITQASDWEDWKKTCAYLNCSEESQSRLGDFGVSRMLNWLESVKGMKGIFFSSENCKSEAWQWFRRSYHSKRFKRWHENRRVQKKQKPARIGFSTAKAL